MFLMSVKALLINTLKETIDCGYLKLILLKSAPWETVEQCQIALNKICYIKTTVCPYSGNQIGYTLLWSSRKRRLG